MMSVSQDVRLKLQEHDSKDLLRFITCGNVDDGKSTLIGRLLLEAGAIYDDQIAALRGDSKRHGTTGERIDTALLLDGLEDERQQGITIDVAYRYFSTSTRKFIIADTPGHEQFTRNMATGASTADLAIVLVDATKGISAQTRRHAYITSLLGINYIVLAINKMDLVDYQERVFQQIVKDFDQFRSEQMGFQVYPIPLSALEGENVFQASRKMPWYAGRPLMEHLETVPIDAPAKEGTLRFPIQWVNRPDASFRGFSGTVASGTLAVGDEILALPDAKAAKIASLVTMDGKLSQAGLGQAVTVTLDRELDLSRGDMLVHPQSPPHVTTDFTANIVWMAEQPLVVGKRYWLKHTTRRTSCEFDDIECRVDVHTLNELPANSLRLNEVGRCRLRTTSPLLWDSYDQNRETGAFIVVDRISHETVGAGMLLAPTTRPGTSGHWGQPAYTYPPQSHPALVTAEDRRVRYGQRPVTILITGLSGSGKTSVAFQLERLLFARGCICTVLDGQALRMGISRDLAFSAEERSENLRRAAEIAKILNDAGQICIAAFVAPSAWVRDKAKTLLGATRFFHVHLATPIEVCRERDQTGQYQAADRGEITNFPGVTVAYETPEDADLVLDATSRPASSLAEDIFEVIQSTWLEEHSA